MNITAKTKLCMVIGDPIEHSLSPQIHNAAYEQLGLTDKFVYTACQIKVSDIQAFVAAIRILGIRGVSCTIPHKQEVLPYIDSIDKTAKTIGAVNTIVNEAGILHGYNTDWLGIRIPLQAVTELQGKNVILLGAGGAARAAAYAVTNAGAHLFVFNRTKEKAEELAKVFQGKVVPSLTPEATDKMDIIVSLTSVGLAPKSDETPLPKACIQKHHIVFDAVYVPYTTRLLAEAKEQGATVIHGTEMLLQQAAAQFELYTGEKAPIAVMRKTLLTCLGVTDHEK